MSREATKTRGIWGTLGLVGTLVAGLVLGGDSSAQAAGLLIADGGFGGQLEIQEHDVEVTINGGIAVTRVRQVFRNTENRQVEALYTFPVPKGGSVANFSMWIGGKEMVGEVLEKERAREIYNSYKRVRRDPGLLEQVDYKTFEMRIFPIAPRAEQRVEVTYYQELDFDADWATYVYPLATTTRRAVQQRTTGKFALKLEVKSEIPIVELESPSHTDDFAVAKHSDFYSEASLEMQGGDLSRDVVLAYHTSRPSTGIDVLTSKEPGDDGYFALTLTAGEELEGHNGGMDFVFVLDVSGSMKQEGKLELSRTSLDAFVKALGKEDRFDIISFNVTANTLFNRLSPAEEKALNEAAEFLASREARGRTALRPAVETAYKYVNTDRQLNVIILSDGLTEQQERGELVRLIRERPKGTRVFCIGVGNDVNRRLLEQIAEESGGLASFISRGDNFTRQAQAFRRKLLKPVATDLKLDFEGLDVYDVEPRRLPNLYHGTPLRVYGRYRRSGNVQISIRGEVAGVRADKKLEIPFPDQDPTSPEIERMWASKRVDRLLKEAEAEGSKTPVVDEIIRLGEQYSIVTEYTSFLVLENDAEYKRWRIERRNAQRIARDRQAHTRLASQLEAIRKRARSDLGPSAAQPTSTAAATPDAASPSTTARPSGNRTPPPQRTSPSRPRSRDISFGGGGAIDPVTGGVALGLAALGALASRRKKSRGSRDTAQN